MKKVKIGVIGAGRIGKLHAENLLHFPQVELKAVSDVYLENVSAWADKLGIPRVTGDYREILEDDEIDAVFVCSSTDTHVSIIMEAARAGKHIFCEKPISFEMEQTKKALKSVKQAGVQLQVGFNRRFDHNFRKVRESIISGKIGNPHIIKVTSRDPAVPPKEYIQKSGGIFIDMTIHDFDMVRYLSGSEVEEVYVQGEVLIDHVFAECGDIDTAVTVLKLKNGAIGVIDNSRKAVYGYDQRVEVFGSKGCITVDNDYPNTALISTAEGVYQDKPKYFFLERYHHAYLEEVKSFIESVLEDRPVLVDGHDGLQAEMIAHAARRSWLEKRPVKLSELQNDDERNFSDCEGKRFPLSS
ncbi:inositol 2-dehydrogenase [Thermoflavimicrobium dichotomicum]|uniref:Myo-inositol 2-dehydrogenase / D-chiro-inositol 1-dehydrogenase n=1 Tax=Thermoflavimicrobium dichotomicum TaxID=46223 RepID=A0A1I3UXS5_9BACL|nr:inositol 2-dehydrogenase [Thermoflavimicrobium dichotomicum]SFJ88184.1 myo-inositol 2-dehydrogenase / D-chiro-inositol 1-dehydrogenase [Thermoflavimicrobium dichotomicum]